MVAALARAQCSLRPRGNGSVAVVRLAAGDLEAAVDLLEDQDPDQPVGDGEAAEGEQPPGPAAEVVAEAVGAADQEPDRGAAAAQLLGGEQVSGEVGARHQLA